MPTAFAQTSDAGGPTSEEAALVARLQAGDDDAFEQMVREQGPAMLSVVRRYLPQDSDAHDALQDAFLSAFKAVGRFQGESSLRTWLHRIAVNAALMKLRAQRRRPERTIDELLPKFLEDGHRDGGHRPWPIGPEQLVADRERGRLVRAAIDDLPESYRTVLMLRDIDEHDTDATAALLGISSANVKTRLHRARQALRELLDRRFGEGNP